MNNKFISTKLNIYSSSQEEAKYIDNQIYEFNNSKVQFTQQSALIFKNYVIKENGIIIAGINAVIYCWNILYIDVLFVDENHRKKQLGSSLLHKVEMEAKELGSTLAHLDTFDFQAKDFYLKHNYEIFGILENCPTGHKRYHLKKIL